MTDPVSRAAAAILRAKQPLSPDFREQVAVMVEALDKCLTELEMVEALHKERGQPYYSDALDAARAALYAEKEPRHDG